MTQGARTREQINMDLDFTSLGLNVCDKIVKTMNEGRSELLTEGWPQAHSLLESLQDEAARWGRGRDLWQTHVTRLFEELAVIDAQEEPDGETSE